MSSSSQPPPNSRDEFEIAIICALPTEYDAVALLIDQFWDEDGDRYERAVGDQNTYTTGRMGSFDIVLVLLPESGKASAASAASSFRSSFSNITLALLVGVCGGVPYTKDNEEILLGDVVISKTVIQYDLGGQYSDSFLTKETLEGRLGRPGRNIRSIVTLMESNHGRERLESRAAVLLEQLQRHAGRKKTRKPVNYEYPGILKDRLFDSNYVHKHQVLLPHRCCEEFPCDRSHILSCDDLGCEDEYLVQRQRLNGQCQNPSIFIGRFGSGDMILKSGTYRDQIAQCHGILAFEMEGAGIWDELPCIIVKGISNYADGHWNAGSNWQQFAAATAAATARALLERYPKTDKPRPRMAVVENRKERSKEEDECLREIRTTDSSLDKKRIEDTNGGLLRDSYVWILSNAEFIQWRHNSDGGLLWIKGDPGKGKTMLICGLIDELQTNRLANLHYFFCQASDSRLNSATKVLRSLVYSIACQDQEALSLVMEKYRHAGRELFHNANSWTAMSQVMNQILRKANLKGSVFIIDGLDECVTDLALLLDFITQAPEHAEAKWIVSSRNWPSIEEKLNTSSKKLLLSLELNEQSVSDAVHIYIKHKVDQLATIKKLDEHSRDVIQAHLSSNANGTFLWVALVYKELFKGGVKKRHLQNLMTAFPPELGPLYARMMEQVCESRDRGVCVQVLELISLTYRPISLLELASLVEILDDDDDFDELRDVIATCGSFLVLKDDVIYFVHQSAKDFLQSNTSDQIFASGIARKHHDIFSRSIQALSRTLRCDIYKLGHPGALPSVPSPDPLAPLQYACVYWVDHLRDTAINSAGKTILQVSLQNEGTVHAFLKLNLLRWLEALCLMGKLSEGILAIRTLKALITQDRGQLHMFTSDALRVVLMFRSAIEYTPLQLYSSALLFTPTSSIIRNTFEPTRTTKWITQKPSVQPEWDARLQTLESHKQAICSLVFSLDNTKLASASKDGNVRVWDRATGACLEPRTSSGRSRVTSMAFSPDGSQLALAQGASVKILDISANTCVMTFNMCPYMLKPQIMFSPNGMQLILSNQFWEAGKFQIWDLNTRMQLQEEDYYQDVGQPAIFHTDAPDECEILAEDNIIVIRSPVTGSCVQVPIKRRIKMVVFSLDGMQFALDRMTLDSSIRRPIYSSFQWSTYVLDAATGKCLQKFEDAVSVNFSMTLSPDGTRLATDHISGIHIWDVKTNTHLSTFSGHTGECACMAFSPDGTELAFAAGDNCIRIWNLTLGASVKSEIKRSVSSVTYSPDGTCFALVTSPRGKSAFTIEIWDHTEGKRKQQLRVNRQVGTLETWPLAFSPDNMQLAYETERRIAIWDLAANLQQDNFEFKVLGRLQAIIFSPSGARLAAADNSIPDTKTSRIEICDVADGTTIYRFYFAKRIMGMHFSSDSKRLGSISADGVAAIFDLVTGTCIQTLDFNLEKIFIRVKRRSWRAQYLRRTKSLFFIKNMLQSPDSIHSAIHEFDLSLNKNWLLRRGEPFLWLPPEYRPKGMTFAGGNIAILAFKERLLLFGFNLVELDAALASNRSSILDVWPPIDEDWILH